MANQRKWYWIISFYSFCKLIHLFQSIRSRHWFVFVNAILLQCVQHVTFFQQHKPDIFWQEAILEDKAKFARKVSMWHDTDITEPINHTDLCHMKVYHNLCKSSVLFLLSKSTDQGIPDLIFNLPKFSGLSKNSSKPWTRREVWKQRCSCLPFQLQLLAASKHAVGLDKKQQKNISILVDTMQVEVASLSL